MLCYICMWKSRAPGGPKVCRVTTEVEVVGSNLTTDYFFQIDRPKARERELAKFDKWSIKSWKAGMLNRPYAP